MTFKSRFIFYASLISSSLLLAAGCNDDDYNDSFDTFEETTAILSIEPTSIGRIYLIHGSESEQGDLDEYLYTEYIIKDNDTDEVVETIIVDDYREIQRIALPSVNDHHIEMRLHYLQPNDLTENNNESETIKVFEADNSVIYGHTNEEDELWVGNNQNCAIICENTSSDNSLATCTTDYYHSFENHCQNSEIIIEEIFSTAQVVNDNIDENSLVCIRAFGSAGFHGNSYFKSRPFKKNIYNTGGTTGYGGVAQTVLKYSDFHNMTDTLYVYLGRYNTSTTILIKDPQDEIDSIQDNSYEFNANDILIMAGGGADGVDATSGINGGHGGDGGIVSTSISGVCNFSAGSNGGGANGHAWYGKGGGISGEFNNSDCSDSVFLSSQAIEGVNNHAPENSVYWGKSGFGGVGDHTFSGWYTSEVLTRLHNGDGAGAYGDHYANGAGGAGGAGGGMGYSGGGGGGSYSQALYSSVNSDSCEYFNGFSTNPALAGYVEFIFFQE
ncbi:hypothetical protein [uncultured Shewanella sp.]|uniref:hypothetical protein n=1 Tax=uncultured Shewanella sp. TaxID=173975 RepID=UPI002625FE1D|nr:hypothetical protein [uncultured Shewanella sp.]